MRILLWLAVLAAPLVAQKRPITHADVWTMKRVGDPAVSPDGRLLVFSVIEPDYDPARQVSDLWIVPADGSAPPKRLTATKGPESGAVFSPDGKTLAFSAKREGDEAAQIYLLPLDGGEARRFTTDPNGASNPQWRPDGRALLYESEVDPVAAERKTRKWSARVYDTFPIRYWNAWLDEKRPTVLVQEIDARSPVNLLAGSKLSAGPGFGGQFNPSGGGQSLDAVWTPDGKGVVFVATANRHETMYAEAETHLWLVSASGGEPKQLTPAGASHASPRFSPRGDALYALETKNAEPPKRLYSLARLVRLAWPQAGEPVRVTPGWDRSAGGYSISADGAAIYLDAEDSGADRIFSVPAAGGEPKSLVPVDRGGYTGVKPVAGGLVARYQTSVQPAEIVRVNPGAAPAYLTKFNLEQVAQIDSPDPLHFWFTARNGKRIHTMISLPPGFDPKRKYPVLLFPHGGPNSMSKDAFSTRWNNALLASPGYVVVQTNYTGSTGFGEAFADEIERDVLRGPAGEILEAADAAARQYPYLDLTRMAAAGASYGGYLMNWFAGHSNRFRCLVNHAGAVNNESQYGANDGGIEREWRMGGPIWERGGQWIEQSPIRSAGQFRTPMLITQGELDFRVPLSESMTTFKLLQRLKVPSRLVLFPDEGHWILKGENSRKHMEEVLGWLKKYL